MSLFVPLPGDAPVYYEPRNWAIPFHKSLERFAALILHRRAGKTTSLASHHQRAATDDDWEARRLKYLAWKGGFEFTNDHIYQLLQRRQYGIVLPTRVQAKLVAWDMLKEIARRVDGRPNESELRIDYKNGSRVQLFGADHPDSFRGAPFSGISFDEYGMQPPNVFSEVVSKNLADHLGYAIFAGTIKGKNQLYKTYMAAKGHKEWFALWQDINQSLKTESGATILTLRQAMVDDQTLIGQGLMTQEEYDQEWFLSTEAAIKGSILGRYLAAARKAKRIGRVPYDEALPVYDVWDLGAGANLSIGCFQRIAREMHMIKYLQGEHDDGIHSMIKKLQNLPYIFGKHFAPHDIRGREQSTGKTRYETAKALGWQFEVLPDIGVDDGIDAAKLLMGRTYFDEEENSAFIEDVPFYRYPWDQKRQAFGDTPVHDFASHPADMFRYAAVAEKFMTNEKPKPPRTPPTGSRGQDGLAWMAN